MTFLQTMFAHQYSFFCPLSNLILMKVDLSFISCALYVVLANANAR